MSTAYPSLSWSVAIRGTRSRFPHRSPYPLMVPWTWTQPACTAASALATARPGVVVGWMPSGAASRSRTAGTRSATTSGSSPPLVSHSTMQSAPASAAACEGGEGVVRVEPPAVEEVFRVEHHLPAELLEPGDALVDHSEILRAGRLQDSLHVEDGGLSHQRDHRRVRGYQRLNVGVLLAEQSRASRAAERGDPGALQREVPHPPEELSVLRIGAGPAAFDDRDPQPVERLGDLHLVVHRERQAFPLGAVAQRGVVEPKRAGRAHEFPEKKKRGLSGRGRGRWHTG